MPMLSEFDSVALRHDPLVRGLKAGAVGTIVFVHADGAAYDVEFLDDNGYTIAVETLHADQVAPTPN